MSNQTEALRLAEILERPGYGWHTTPAQCAAELRRLAAEVQRIQFEQQNTHEAWEALSAHAEKLRAENAALRRGEFICGKCGLRKDADATGPAPF